MNGNGGTVAARLAAREAAKTIMSGPASGVMAAAATLAETGVAHAITYDMGGTSTDVALIRGGIPEVSAELTIDYGLPIHVPMVDVRSIGAGGGSIASINAAGMLEVGPRSAGSEPGPICYGRGGSEPTITDANLLLGRLDPAALLSVPSPAPLEQVREVFERRSASRWDWLRMRPPPPCSSLPTRTCVAPFAWCRLGVVTTRATSACSPSAAPARCTRWRWRANWASPR